ncbi:MAG TPA: hypothetical protein VGN52_01035 [Burkholderiales bacterium]|jgi:hypothetical protein
MSNPNEHLANSRTAAGNSPNILADIFNAAANKPGFSARVDTEEIVRRVTLEPQADIRRISLRTLQVQDVLNAGPDAVLPGPGNPGIVTRIATDVIELNSRAVGAGAKIVLIQDAPQATKDSAGDLVLFEWPAGYVVAEPAAFSQVADGDNVTPSAVPVHRAVMDRSTAPAFMFNTSLSRREMKSWMNGTLENGTLLSILSGLGRVVDSVLLTAILAATPGAFSIGAAAARGLKIEGLRGLVGTSGNGAGFNGVGMFCAANIPAEITGDMAQSLVGDFQRSAVGLFEDITLIANRLNLDGSMSITAVANCQALIPVAGALLPFWTVGA